MTSLAKTAAIAAVLGAGIAGPCPAENGFERRLVEIETPLASSRPLQGYLRQPQQKATSPAVVLLHGCNGGSRQIDERWGKRISSWGYLTLALDRFGSREGLSSCTSAATAETIHDAYRALAYLVQLPAVDPERVAVIGFAQGGLLALDSVERGFIERAAQDRFRAAVAFYPPCLAFKNSMTVPTLILVGELDDWTPANECRNLAEGRDDYGISRHKGQGVPIELIVYAGAYHDFDVPELATPAKLLGHHLEFNAAARDQSIDALRKFLYATIGRNEKMP